MAIGLLNEEDRNAIRETIRGAETRTSGEIVFAIADASARYQHANLVGALLVMTVATAAYLAIPVTHTIGMLLWTELASFAIAFAVVPYLSWRRFLIPEREMNARVEEAAFMEFYSSGLHRTRDSNGVLIYLSILEHEVFVLGDRAIHQMMGESQWQAVKDAVIRGIRDGRPKDGICKAVEMCGDVLARHFPRKPDDTNELPDQVIDRRLGPDAP